MKRRFSAVPLSFVCLALLLFASCDDGDTKSAGGDEGAASKVLVLGMDGMAWEVIAPMLQGENYPMIEWGDSMPVPARHLSYLDHEARKVEGPVTEKDGAVVVDQTGKRDVRALAFFKIDFADVPYDRFRVECEVRVPKGDARARLGAFYNFGKGIKPRRKNQRIYRHAEPGNKWTKLTLELHPPTRATGLFVALFPVPLKDQGPKAAPKSYHYYLEARNISLRMGSLATLPPEGFDFDSLDPAKNRLPNLTRLMMGGAVGSYKTLNPGLSPLIWTTMVTGVSPKKHGIDSFLKTGEDGKRRIINGRSRRVKALWNIVTEYGDSSVGVVHWWASWPADEVRGFNVSDHAGELMLKITRDKGYLASPEDAKKMFGQRTVYPPDLLSRVEATQVAPEDMGREELKRFVPGADEEVWLAFQGADKVDSDQPLSVLKYFYAKDSSVAELALELKRKNDTDLTMVFFNGIDAVEHLFWKWADPRLFPAVKEEDARMYGQVIEGYYEFMDEVLGRYLEEAGPDTVVFLVSDHGHYPVDFMTTRSKGPSGGHKWNCPGVFIANGPGVKKGYVAKDAGVYHLAPTVLYFMDYPIARDLDGKVLAEIVEPELAEEKHAKTIDTYGVRQVSEADELEELPDDIDEKALDRLRALGYIE